MSNTLGKGLPLGVFLLFCFLVIFVFKDRMSRSHGGTRCILAEKKERKKERKEDVAVGVAELSWYI